MNAFNRSLTAALTGIVLFSGCTAISRLRSAEGTKFRYTYALTLPVRSPRLVFEDNDAGFLFRLDDSGIRFKLTNKSPSSMRIKWDQATIVVRGRSHAVRNTRTLYLAHPADYANPTILPGGYVIDLALPSENISFDGKQWKERDLLPTTDRHSEAAAKRILKQMGNTVMFLLPLEVGDRIRRYDFEFTVARVDTLEWERYRKPRRPVPPPPGPRIGVEESDQITTAIVVGGFLGFAAYLLSQKKTPPSE